MDRFLSPKGSSSAASSCSAAHHGCPVDSGGDDGRGMTLEVKIECVRDVERWLATVNVASGNPEVGSVREAIAVSARMSGHHFHGHKSAELLVICELTCMYARCVSAHELVGHAQPCNDLAFTDLPEQKLQ